MKMKTTATIWVILITPLTLIGQSQKVYVYDFDTEILDSFSVIFDSTVQEAQTKHCVGYYDNNIVDLPINPLISGAISPRQPLDLDYNITDFPFRTTVKIFSNVDYSSEPIECTGQMVSGRHVLTAFFCVAAFIDNNLTLNAVTVCPNYNNIESDEFGCISVQKMYFFSIKEFGLDRFFCLLELEAPVGLKTGWLGTGFSQNATFMNRICFIDLHIPTAQVM